MWWALLCSAFAADVQVAARVDVLHPDLPAEVLVAVTDEIGVPASSAPEVTVRGGAVRLLGPEGDGIWSYLVEPPATGDQVVLTVQIDGERVERSLPLQPLPPSALSLPRRIDAAANAESVTFLVRGDDLPPPEALQVAVGAGRLLGVEREVDGLSVTISPEESRFPRFVPIGVRDARRPGQPVWTGLRLHTRPRIALQTEPGTKVTLTVAGRDYGPFLADAEGIVSAEVEQFPGELVAQAVLVDDLGNETTTTLPLASHTQAALVALPSGALVPGRPSPPVFLRAVHGDGHPWTSSKPVCRSALRGDLEVVALGSGDWVMPLGELRGLSTPEVRVQCALGAAAETSFRVPLAEGLPARMRLALWPEELSNDFPVAEVQVLLEDTRGERMPVDGVSVQADLGHVTMDPNTGYVARGEYAGQAAVEVGEDLITARFDLPPGQGFLARVEVGHGSVPASGEVEVYGRALDAAGRPLAGLDLALSVGEGIAYAQTARDGWCLARLPRPEQGPVLFAAKAGGRVARTIALTGASQRGGPGQPDLSAAHVVTLSAGRAREIVLEVDPPVIYSGSGGRATVTVTVLDRAGNPLPEALVDLEASEGSLGMLFSDGFGGYRAEYRPPPGDRGREISLVASFENTSTTAIVSLEPRPLERAVGIAFGAVTNFGAIASPMLSFDLDLRTPAFGGALVVRLGVATYGDVAEVETGFGDPARLRLTLMPITVALMARRDLRGRALWLGLGGVISPWASDARFGDTQLERGFGVLPPGLEVLAGVGQRFGGGEVMLELRALALTAQGGALAYQGPVGGMGLLLGYRFIF